MSLLDKKWYWLWISFITGFSSMALEMTASRLLAPYFGTSTVVWTSVIGVILLSLSTGYYIGGRLAEKKLQDHILLRTVFVGGLFIICIPTLAKPLLGALAQYGQSHSITAYLIGGSLLATLILFAFPVFLFGCVSPYALSLVTQKFGHMAQNTGRLLAISTLGGLLGTFTPVLLLIPGIGTTKTILLLGALLVLSTLVHIKKLVSKALILAAVAATPFTASKAGSPNTKTLAEIDSVYQHITITEHTSGVRYMQFDAGFGIQSVYLPNRLQTGLYYDYASLLPALLPNSTTPKKVLLIGLAGGTIARQMHAYYGDTVAIDAVELDPAATKLALEYMNLGDTTLTIHHQDGRTFLKESKELYDFIYVDTYQNELQIPWINTTAEFWKEIEARLTPEGFAAINVAALGSRESTLVNAIANTQRSVFPHVYTAELQQHRNGSHMLVATPKPLPLAQLEQISNTHPELIYEARFLEWELREWKPRKGVMLTDDRTPLEWLMLRDVLNKQ